MYERIKYVKVWDVTPLSIGQKVQGGVMEVMIKRNTQIPCEHKETFANAHDNQQIIQCEIYQGERQMVKDNQLLGKF